MANLPVQLKRTLTPTELTEHFVQNENIVERLKQRVELQLGIAMETIVTKVNFRPELAPLLRLAVGNNSLAVGKFEKAEMYYWAAEDSKATDP